MVGADSSVSVIDQVIQFTALFVILFPYFQYNRLIKPLVFRAQLIQLADGPAQVKLLIRQVDLSKAFFYILYNKIEKMHNLTSWASRKKYIKPWSLSDKKGHHFTDSIKPHLRSGCFPFHSQTLILVNRLAVWGSVNPPALPGDCVRRGTFSSGIFTLLNGVWASQCFTLWVSSEQVCFPSVPETGCRMMTVLTLRFPLRGIASTVMQWECPRGLLL